MASRAKRVVQVVGAALAVFVPAVVVAQFQSNQQLTAARLNQTANNQCEIVVRNGEACGTSCTADCDAGLVVMGGGCRTNAPATALRASTPRFSSGAFPDPDSFNALLVGGGTVENFPGSGAPPAGAVNPRWNGWSCEAVTGGTIQTAYAICCPFVQ